MKRNRAIDLARIPPGVQYFFGDEVVLRRGIERDVLEVFAGWSYGEIILPIFDHYDLFALGMGEDVEPRTYRFTARDGATVALRPDLTSLVARTVATRLGDRERPLRLSYSGEVFRADEPRRGRQHEFHQIGLEHIGQASPAADIEVLLVAVEVLERLGLDDARLVLGHAEFFNGIAHRLDLDAAGEAELRDLVDRRRAGDIDRFLEPHASAEERAGFCRLIELGGGREVLELARSFVTNPRSRAALDEIESIHATIDALGLARLVTIDLGEVADLDYYTGVTFKIYVPGWGLAIGGGGRYDRLLAQFGHDEPAIGFSLSLDWVVGALAARGRAGNSHDATPCVRIEDHRDARAIFAEARRLRSEGQTVEIVPGPYSGSHTEAEEGAAE